MWIKGDEHCNYVNHDSIEQVEKLNDVNEQ